MWSTKVETVELEERKRIRKAKGGGHFSAHCNLKQTLEKDDEREEERGKLMISFNKR
jgi:hypothetical protein